MSIRDTKDTKDIRTSTEDTVCGVCGRTLLRGEHADAYLNGATRHEVCELCKDRALNEGWIREGTVSGYGDGQPSSERRGSLLARLRAGRRAQSGPATGPSLRDELDGRAWTQDGEEQQAELDGLRSGAARPRRERQSGRVGRGWGGRARSNGQEPAAVTAAEFREPRHIRAVPTSAEQKIVAAAGLFNDSEHPRTVAGVARSLGPPGVCVMPLATSGSGVSIVVSWELCWYRYEVDLSDEVPSVRAAGQGYELSELAPGELQLNAAADEHGRLLPAD